MPYLPLAPWHWEHGSLSLGKLLAQLSLAFQGSKDCNPRSAPPSDVRGNRRIIISLADHGETALRPFFSGMDRSVRNESSRTSWRFPYIASCSGNVPPCWVFGCQGKVRQSLAVDTSQISEDGTNINPFLFWNVIEYTK